MTFILGILKIIGITLLVILLAVVLLIFSVLFVPIRYKLQGQYHTSFSCKLNFHWLFHLLGMKIYTIDEEQNVVITFLGIPIWNKKRSDERKRKKADKATKVSHKSRKKKNTSQKGKSNKEVKVIRPKSEPEDNSQTSQAEGKTADTSDEPRIAQENSSFEEDEHISLKEKICIFLKSIIRFFQSIYRMLQNMKYTFERICDKIKKTVSDITYYKELFQNKRVKCALATIKTWVSKFFGNIKPQKVLIHITFGMDDPSIVGDILSIYSILYPWIGQSVIVSPYFEETPVSGDFLVKGRITLFWIAYAIWKYLFDKDIRYLKRRVIREEK